MLVRGPSGNEPSMPSFLSVRVHLCLTALFLVTEMALIRFRHGWIRQVKRRRAFTSSIF
jgi:CBS domain containing-hemolysin-like protein